MGERLTQSDVDKIKQEIEYRTLVVRKEANAAVQEARAQGDLSENFEYYAAKRDRNKNESRIRYLDRMLKNATVISDESADGTVGINKLVEVYLEDEDVTETFKLVTSVRCDSLAGKVSIESPIGKALNGHRVGDRVYVKINERMGYYATIRSIREGDDADDEIRPY